MLGKIIGFTVGGIAVGVGAVLLAPVVLPTLGAAGLLGAASTGTAISTLSGAALASASSAAVTGTIAGTTAVIGGAGATTGAAVGTMVGHKADKRRRR